MKVSCIVVSMPTNKILRFRSDFQTQEMESCLPLAMGCGQ